jgi:5-methylcytosine-specific restriction endonuclease McrA
MPADLKPPRRIVDPGAYRQFHRLELRCLVCGTPKAQAHHVLSRGRGGDDLMDNFVPLCVRCHNKVHGEDIGGAVRRLVGKWLGSEDGQEARAYLVGKLGRGAAESFMKREYGLRMENT